MAIAPFAAAQAYANAAASAGSSLAGGATAAKEATGAGFGQMLNHVLSETVHTTKNAEQAMANQVAGKSELIDVVTAISSAESSLETVMAIRDQVISAYQEIMRMPI